MGFMVLVSSYMRAYIVETNCGSAVVPYELVGDLVGPEEEMLKSFEEYCEGEPINSELVSGWFAYYSAPGYLDRTDYVGPFSTEEEARKECKELYGDEEDEEGEEK